MKKIVFLHIPKTAGQSVHSELFRIYGKRRTSPIRVHHQANQYQQFPEGYDLYSGHLDWHHPTHFEDDVFSFTVLRDPYERIASFYFYLRQKSLAASDRMLSMPEHTGLRRVKNWTPNDYFFGGDVAWRTFIKDHYDNFYCSYMATGKVRGTIEIAEISREVLIERAVKRAKQLSRIYQLSNLNFLEEDIYIITGHQVYIQSTRINAGPKVIHRSRWQDLMSLINDKPTQRRLEKFAESDVVFMKQLGDEGLLI